MQILNLSRPLPGIGHQNLELGTAEASGQHGSSQANLHAAARASGCLPPASLPVRPPVHSGSKEAVSSKHYGVHANQVGLGLRGLMRMEASNSAPTWRAAQSLSPFFVK